MEFCVQQNTVEAVIKFNWNIVDNLIDKLMNET